MDEPNFDKRGKDSLKEPHRFDPIFNYTTEIVGLILVFIGLVLSFFYILTGSTLVGLGFGFTFHKEIFSYFLRLKEYFTEQGILKTLVLIGTILFLLVTLPAFIIAAVIGFGVMLLFRWSFRKY